MICLNKCICFALKHIRDTWFKLLFCRCGLNRKNPINLVKPSWSFQQFCSVCHLNTRPEMPTSYPGRFEPAWISVLFSSCKSKERLQSCHWDMKFPKYEAAHACCQQSDPRKHLIYNHEQRICREVQNWISLLVVQAADSSEEIQMHLHGVNFCKHVLHSSKEINVKVSLASNKKGWVIFLQFHSKDAIFYLPQSCSHKTDSVSAPLWETVFKHRG